MDILCLAPALDTPRGHPAVWEKLLANLIPEAAAHQVTRLFADVPDQPLLVNTLSHVGFNVYARQTVWRLTASDAGEFLVARPNDVRAVARGDEWNLMRLYATVTPKTVREAEGVAGEAAQVPPTIVWPYGGDVHTFVHLGGDRPGARGDDITGCVKVVFGKAGVLMQFWVDSLQDSIATRSLVAAGLEDIRNRRTRLPVYVLVKGYQGGLAPVLADFGFAPFTDHARMVKPLLQRVVEMETVRAAAKEALPEALVTSGPLFGE